LDATDVFALLDALALLDVFALLDAPALLDLSAAHVVVLLLASLDLGETRFGVANLGLAALDFGEAIWVANLGLAALDFGEAICCGLNLFFIVLVLSKASCWVLDLVEAGFCVLNLGEAVCEPNLVFIALDLGKADLDVATLVLVEALAFVPGLVWDDFLRLTGEDLKPGFLDMAGISLARLGS